MVWIVVGGYFLVAVVFAIRGSYESPPHPDHAVRELADIGLRAMLWPIWMIGLAIGTVAFWFALTVIDRVIEWIQTRERLG
jgi:Na+/H+ antiporter NhaC